MINITLWTLSKETIIAIKIQFINLFIIKNYDIINEILIMSFPNILIYNQIDFSD